MVCPSGDHVANSSARAAVGVSGVAVPPVMGIFQMLQPPAPPLQRLKATHWPSGESEVKPSPRATPQLLLDDTTVSVLPIQGNCLRMTTLSARSNTISLLSGDQFGL